MKEGSLVECVKRPSNLKNECVNHPNIGDVLTVRAIRRSRPKGTHVLLFFEEIVIGYIDRGNRTYDEIGGLIECFRELQPPMDLSELLEETKRKPDFDRARREINDYLNTLYP